MERFRNILKRVDPVGWIVPALVVLVWLWLSASGQIPAYKLPSPVELVRVLADFASGGLGVTPYSGALWENLGISLLRVLSGFFIAGSLGMIMGFLTGRIPVLKRLFDPVIHLIKAVPGIGWLPIAIVWFGVGEGNTLFLMSLAAFFPVYVNTAAGAAAIPEMYIQAGQMLGAQGFGLFRAIVFPAAFPQAAVGLRLGLSVAWAYLVLGEVTGVTKGLGAIMSDARMLGHVEMVLTAMIVIAVAAKVTDFLLVAVCRRIYPRGGRGNESGI
ncbi:NitT/TauT family transport system permease protein [Eubacterium callanderi]|uniref:ABC transporter permease n=1 Tax=Eubacterium callanderi TaxID=53442 RepID=UPI0008EE9B9A|nr:ABC transporter permease [Eubacterium callanderi]SFO97721.1 NitT/TauT family transport system permease protein [Eubacterium callanderi]